MSPQANNPDERRPDNPVKPDGLHLLTNGELELLQSIAFSHTQQASGTKAMLLFGRVWFRLEQERRRRRLEVQELERLYFAR